MFSSLPISGLPKEHGLLSPGQYWLFCSNGQDAGMLMADYLTGGMEHQNADLICAEARLDQLLKVLPSSLSAKVSVHTYVDQKRQTPDDFVEDFFGHPEQLQRFIAGSHADVVVLQASLVTDFGQHWVAANHYRFNQWLKRHGKTLLVIVDGPGRPEIPLNSIAGTMEGCAMLDRFDAALVLDLYFWQSRLGLFSGLRYRLQRLNGQFQLDIASQASAATYEQPGTDERKIVFQRASLLGLPLLSDFWSVADDYAALLNEAGRAHSATLVFALDSNELVRQMAADFQHLRASGNTGIKLVVRETLACLRYCDQKALLLAGASFIIPESVSSQHMLLYLSALQGLKWNRPLLADVDSLLEKLQPLDARGILDIGTFKAMTSEVLHGSAGELTHQLLEFRLRPTVPADALREQMKLRRQGDIAAFAGDWLYLFLFACPDSRLRLALRKIFRLPVADLFDGMRKLSDSNVLTNPASADEDMLQQLGMPADSPQLVTANVLQPRLIRVSPRGR